MPATVRLPDGRLLAAIRCQGGATARYEYWIDLYQSPDRGASWSHLGRPAPATGGNPPTLTLLHDGRLCLTYGYRLAPYGLRAQISEDGGANWSAPLVLRDDGGSSDLG